MNTPSPEWVRTNRRAIINRIVARYGDQWRKCFTPAVQQALFNSEVLHVILGQALPEYAPAQQMAQAIHQDQTT